MNLVVQIKAIMPSQVLGHCLKIMALVLASLLINACGASSSNSTQAESGLPVGMARLTVTIPGLNKPANWSNTSKSTAQRDGVPAEVTSLLIEVLNSQSEILDAAEVIATNGTVSLIIEAGENYTLRGRAFAGTELLFMGETTLVSVKSGTGTSVNLTLSDQITLSLVSPGDIEIGTGSTLTQFTLSGLSDTAINWYVNGVLGGSAEFGLITSEGRYSPPASLPVNPVIVILAEPVVSPSFAQSFSFTLLPVDTTNNAPTANAGPDQTVNEQSTVTLNGSSSDDSDGTITGFSWSQTSGSLVTLSDTNIVMPQFTAPTLITSATLTFSLTVTDNDGATSSDTVSIVIQPVNATPVASAGADQTVNPGVPVTLSAAGSNDTDGSIVSFSWLRISGTLTPVVSNANTASATFTSPSTQYGGQVTYRLTVTDNEGATAMDDITITVNGTDQPLVANAGPDQVVSESTLVTLDGSASNDPDNSITTYLWEELSGGGLVLSNTGGQTPTFNAPAVSINTDLQFRLTVTNDNGDQAQDTITVTVNNVVLGGDKVYFAATTTFANHTIWVTDGTDPGTQQISTIETSNFDFSEFKTIGDFLYFSGNDGTNGIELWRTDGTLANTEMFASAPDAAYVGEGASASGSPNAYSVLTDKLLFRAVTSSLNGSNRSAQYLSLDTVTKLVTPLSIPAIILFSNNNVGTSNNFSYFYKKNSTPVVSTVLYRTDGINTATVVNSFSEFSDLHDFTEVNGELFFIVGNSQLWKTDGTGAGTILLKTFTGIAGKTGNFVGEKNAIAFNNELIFVADDGEGRELWKSDGTVSGTVLVRDLDATIASSNPTEFSIVNGRLVFLSSNAGASTDGLWVTDGTTAGTVRISTVQVNSDISSYDGYSTGVTQVVDSLNLMFFTANDGVNGNELWATDGTAIGTNIVKNIGTAGNSEPSMFSVGNGFLVFSAQDDDFRAKLWRTDGTDPGTTLIRDINPMGIGNSAFFQLGG